MLLRPWADSGCEVQRNRVWREVTGPAGRRAALGVGPSLKNPAYTIATKVGVSFTITYTHMHHLDSYPKFVRSFCSGHVISVPPCQADVLDLIRAAGF
jgi:hypothetical protein